MGPTGCFRCEKIPTWLRAMNFCINCTSSPHFAPSFMQLGNDPKCTKTLWNAPKHEFMVQWLYCVGCENLPRDFVARIFVWIEPFQYVLQQVLCSYEMIPNAPKYNKTDRIISLGSNGVGLVRSLRKIPTWFCGTNFCINCSSSHRFAPSFM